MPTTAAASYLATANLGVDVRQATEVETYTANFSLVGDISSTRATTETLLIAVGIIGAAINGFVIFVFSSFKELRKNTTNVLIVNQTAIDIIACMALTATMIIEKTRASDNTVGFIRRIMCWFFDNYCILGASLCAYKFSLVVVTLERYVKVVHPVKHRNDLRPWMIKLGIIVPWIDSFLSIFLPLTLTSDVVDDVCHIALQGSENGRAFSTFVFAKYFLLPLLVFIFCYSRILTVVRRQNRIRTEASLQPSSATAGPSGGNRRLPGVEVDVPSTEQSAKLRRKNNANAIADPGDQQTSKMEKKVIRTMLTISACYIICWFPMDFYQILYCFLPRQVSSSAAGTQFMIVLAYTNVVLTAAIYSIYLGAISRSCSSAICIMA
jgi:hypothetical protein